MVADVTNQCPDAGNLLPMLQQVVENLGPPTALTADAGYRTAGMDEACTELGTEVYVSTVSGCRSRQDLARLGLTELARLRAPSS